MTTRAGIRVESVTVDYATPGGTIRALDDVSLDVSPGQSLSITGPSGCGKSTLLGLIGGLDTPTGGSVWIGDLAISRLPAARRTRLRRHDLGLVLQSDNLLAFLTAAENVALRLAMLGDGDGSRRPLELLDELGVAAEADKLPDQLSGGQRQRVAVAVALVHRPRIILAYEPTGALDADNSVTVVDLLLRAQRDLGATLVVVTHDADLARRTDRTAAMSDGRLAPEPVQIR